jgi:anti-sigma factor RsiW
MTGRVIRFDGGAHHPAEELLPWYVNGTLDPDERAEVQAHLDRCSHCRVEVDALRAFRGEYAERERAPDPGPSLARLRARMAEQAAPPRGHASRRAPSQPQGWLAHPGLRGWLPWAFAAQTASIAILCVVLLALGDRPAEYRTLGAAEPAAKTASARGNVVVAFEPQLPEAELRRIVRATGARIVDGPTSTHAYVLDVPAPQVADTLTALRGEQGVRLAERLEEGK